MSKVTKFLAGCAFAGIVALTMPGTAQAQFWVGGFHAGWGWGPYLYYGSTAPSYAYQVFPPPRYYDDVPASQCDWVAHVWRDDRRVSRRAQRCR
jgi:hypothetical protein